jgi:hypothetical protein
VLHFASKFCKLKHVDFISPAISCKTYKFHKLGRDRLISTALDLDQQPRSARHHAVADASV